MTKRLGSSSLSSLTTFRTQPPAPTIKRPAELETVLGRRFISTNEQRDSSRTPIQDRDESRHGTSGREVDARGPLGQIAKQKQANRELFTNLLSAAATKRDAKAYITRLKSPSKVEHDPKRSSIARPQVNLGNLFPKTRAVDESPVFSQYETEQKLLDEETLHVALVHLSDLDTIQDHVLVGLAETLCQLARLSMSPCVVLDLFSDNPAERRKHLKVQAERLAAAIDAMSDQGARIVEDIFVRAEQGQLEVPLKRLLSVPLRRGLIPIIIPSAFSEQQQKLVSVSAHEAVLALTKEFAELNNPQRTQTPARQMSLDRIIVIDQAGGIPNAASRDGKHVFLNLAQEYDPISHRLTTLGEANSQRHLSNLKMLREALELLPHSASGLIATPAEAANMSQPDQDTGPAFVGTRRQKNTLIHNLLTDKPAYSSSLPNSRLTRTSEAKLSSPVSTFVKHGMPLTVLPDPTLQAWTPDGPRIQLTDPEIDLSRLVYLIDDSFNRKLDVENYLKRVNDRIAGIIIAGNYEGGAILTWETPPGVDTSDTGRLVPYLDKFAVLKKSQGAGGVADILFNAMVRTCFPNGVCWRSRKNNPVNKWYFERSRGTKKIPDMNWTMFWTTPGVAEDSHRFQDYEGVCRGVEPTWLDKKLAAD